MVKLILLIVAALLFGCASIGEYKKLDSVEYIRTPSNVASVASAQMPAPAASANPIKVEVTQDPAETTRSKFEDISKQLYSANMAYTVPDKVNIKDHFKVQLLIDPSKGMRELLNALTVSGSKNSQQIKVSRVVNAKITAPDFHIDAISPADQAISNTDTTEWLWTLSPKSPGKHEINITVTALITVDGKSSTHHLKTYESSVLIEVTAGQIITTWLSKYWQWLITTFIIPLGIWIYRKKFGKKED